MKLVNDVLKNQSDSIALIDSIVNLQDDLLDNKDDMKAVEEFYHSQITLFENADKVLVQTTREMDYYNDDEDVNQAIHLIKEVVRYDDNYNYSRIPQLNGAIATIKNAKNILLESKKQELLALIDQCFSEIDTKAKEDNIKLAGLLNQARVNFDSKKDEISNLNDLITLEAKKQKIFEDTNKYIRSMDKALKPDTATPPKEPTTTTTRRVKEYYRQVIFPTKTIKNEADIDLYLDELKTKLMNLISDGDEVKLK